MNSSHQVQAIAENLLVAYNLGDYRAFSRDLSLPARLIVDEATFAEFRKDNLPAIGPFVAVTDVQPESGMQDPEHLRYQVRVQFQNVNAAALVITLSREGQVEGLELYPRGRW